jgi:methyltransferase (TIGR00027 family)
MQVRTRVIDDQLRAWLARGGRQLVVLGAGYDCRALRLPELAVARVFEVDHPATQAHKRAVLARLGATSPASYVTWDFEAQPMSELPAALAAAELDRGAPTFTIWEGVTMYLTEPAIDASLRAIRAYSAAGSQLALSYFERQPGKRRSWRSRVQHAAVAWIGEPWRFAWSPGQLRGYLAQRDFVLVDNVGLGDAARRLIPSEPLALSRWAERYIALAATESVALAG